MRCLLFTVIAAVICGHLVAPVKAAALATPRPVQQIIQVMSVEEGGYAGDGRGYGYRVPNLYFPGYYPPPVYSPYYATPW